MFYFVVYKSRPAFHNLRSDIALSYQTVEEAEKFKNYVIDRATECGATISEENGYYKIAGKLALDSTYFFSPYQKDMYYVIGIETDDNKFDLYEPDSSGSVPLTYEKDGLEFEKEMAEAQAFANTYKEKELQKQQQKQEAEKQTLNSIIQKFEQEISNETDLTKILTSLVKYARRKNAAEQLIALAVNKIQGDTKPVEEPDWYDELSDINN